MDGIDFISQVIKFIHLNAILEKDIWCVVLTIFMQIIRNSWLCWLSEIYPGDFPLEVPWPLQGMAWNAKKNSCWQVLLVWS